MSPTTEVVAYRLVARSPFHFGERGVGMEESSVVLHADTLFSALCLTLIELGQDPGVLFTNFPRYTRQEKRYGEPPFLLSSAFPFSGKVYFFQRPLIRPVGLDDTGNARLGKTLKKIKYVSRRIFEMLLNDQSLAEEIVESATKKESARIAKDLLLQDGQVLVSRSELPLLKTADDILTGNRYIWNESARPHVTVDRVSNTSQVYSVGQVRFASDSGLFLLVSYNDRQWKELFEKALHVLGDTGVGGERSNGNGQFNLEIDNKFSLKQPENAKSFTSLSIYWPTHDEVQAGILAGANYTLLNRRGWIDSPAGKNLRKWDVHVLSEGCVLAQKPVGALVDVGPLDQTGNPLIKHEVWRYGLAYPVGCHMIS